MKYIAIMAFVALSACASVSIPASGVTSNGDKWSGYFTVKEIKLSGGNTICAGKPAMGFGKVQTNEVSCDDGRTATVTSTRTSMRGGVAEVVFSDGMTGQFNYGS